MKKNLVLTSLMSMMLLASCNSQPTPSTSASLSDSADSTTTDLIKDETIFSFDEFEIGVNDWYQFNDICKSDYATAWIDYYFDDPEIAYMSADDFIHGKKIGTTKVKAVFDETYYDEFTLKVVAEDIQKMKLDAGRLKNKSFVVFGDSISDVTVTAYTANRPKFWCEQLVSKFNMTMYNYAVSGSTTGYSAGLMSKGDFRSIVGTNKVNQAGDDIKKSDFAFIYFGNNDVTYACNIGNIGDINDENYLSYESFKGAYAYIIDKIRLYNPNIKIICLSLSSSSWGIEAPKNPTAVYAKSRKELSNVVKDIALAKNAKFIDIYGLWNAPDNTYCPDGIHPQTPGYELIVNEILKQ